MANIPFGDDEIPIFNKYILEAKKDFGGSIFGVCVFQGRDFQIKEPLVFKLGYLDSNEDRLISHEYEMLNELENIKRVPKVKDYGIQGNYIILIMNLLGPSLKNLLKECGDKFTLATTLKISLQLLDILKQIHKKGIILRYMKPDNMTIGAKDNKRYIYIIDFGLAKKYIKNGQHIKFKNKKHTLGNRHYISINIHEKKQASRRDDIESLGYNMIYFLKGKLPWTNIKKSDLILEKKKETNLDELCENCPIEFKSFIEYAKKLEFVQEPDYDYLNGLLLKAAKKNGIDVDKVEYDWEILEKNKKEEKENKEKNISNEGDNYNKDKNDSINAKGDKGNDKKINNNAIVDDDNNNGEKKNEINKNKEVKVINKGEIKENIEKEGNDVKINDKENKVGEDDKQY